MSDFKVVFYTTVSGRSPAYDFISSTNISIRTTVYGLIKVLEEKGNLLSTKHSKSLGNGIFELRGNVNNNQVRALYFFCKDKKIVITNVFIKKTQKTPLNEIRIARQRRKEYLER